MCGATSKWRSVVRCGMDGLSSGKLPPESGGMMMRKAMLLRWMGLAAGAGVMLNFLGCLGDNLLVTIGGIGAAVVAAQCFLGL